MWTPAILATMVELEGEWKLLRYLEMVYSNGKIIEFEEK